MKKYRVAILYGYSGPRRHGQRLRVENAKLAVRVRTNRSTYTEEEICSIGETLLLEALSSAKPEEGEVVLNSMFAEAL